MINIVYAFFDTFAIVDAATQGGPGKDTAILVYKVYYDGFKALDLGGSAAQSVVLMVIVIALTVVQFRYVEKKVQLLSAAWSRRRPLARRRCRTLVLIAGRADRRASRSTSPSSPRRRPPRQIVQRADVAAAGRTCCKNYAAVLDRQRRGRRLDARRSAG